MSGSLTFLGWQRSGIYNLAGNLNGDPANRRLSGSIALRLQERDGPGVANHQAGFQIMGPGDVKSLAQRAVTRMAPLPNSSNAETTLCVHVELAAADLPWRFTPQLPNNKHLRPWIVLVVGTATESDLEGEIDLLPDNLIRLRRPVLLAHPLDQAARWAHVQIALQGEHPNLETLSQPQLETLIQSKGGKAIARLLSPRPLTPNRRHIAAIVPVFRPNAEFWWGNNPPAEVVLPVYRHWRFRSGEGGDFRTLAARLRAVQPDPGDGQAPVIYDRIEPPTTITMRGALGPIGGADEEASAAVKADLAGLATPPTDPRGRPVIGLPVYGAAWRDAPNDTSWGESANQHPGYRGGAGLGADAAIDLQEPLVETVNEQIGAVQEAAQRINQLVAGLQAAGALWRQHLPQSPQQRLLLYGPSMRRMVSANGPVLNQITGDERPLPPALFSSAARRLLRYGPARTALAKPDAILPGAILEEANRCPPLPEAYPPDGNHVDILIPEQGMPPLKEVWENLDKASLDDVLSALDEFVQSLPDEVRDSNEFRSFWDLLIDCIQTAYRNKQQFDFVALAEILAPLVDPNADLSRLARWNCERHIFDPDDSFDELEEDLDTEPPDRPCRPVDLEAVEESLSDAIDPTGDNPWVVDLVLDGIEGLPDPPLAPVEICTGVDLPAWRFLRDRHPDWLLPGVNRLASDSVSAFESNPTFVDSFLLGINTQLLAELHWRNIPIAAGCTPLKMFWGRINPVPGQPANTLARANDILDIGNWSDGSALGDPSHHPDQQGSANLVLVIRSDLFRRYPATLVSAVQAMEDAAGDPLFGRGHEPAENAPRAWPNFQGSIGEDVTFFGFDLTPEQARRYWIVLEEPASGYRFRSDQNSTATNGADFAAATLNIPTRVLISGPELIPE